MLRPTRGVARSLHNVLSRPAHGYELSIALAVRTLPRYSSHGLSAQPQPAECTLPLAVYAVLSVSVFEYKSLTSLDETIDELRRWVRVMMCSHHQIRRGS